MTAFEIIVDNMTLKYRVAIASDKCLVYVSKSYSEKNTTSINKFIIFHKIDNALVSEKSERFYFSLCTIVYRSGGQPQCCHGPLGPEGAPTLMCTGGPQLCEPKYAFTKA